MKAIEAYKRALAAHNSQTAGSREAYARARADADRASERGQTPLIDALMARRMQGLLTGR